jgi:hypothetical protein
MILSVLFAILFSWFIIFIGHQIWNYIKDNYSVEKTEYLMSSQIEKYKTIIEELQNPRTPPDFETDIKGDLEEFLHTLTPASEEISITPSAGSVGTDVKLI